jgi:hypothetical protein
MDRHAWLAERRAAVVPRTRPARRVNIDPRSRSALAVTWQPASSQAREDARPQEGSMLAWCLT